MMPKIQLYLTFRSWTLDGSLVDLGSRVLDSLGRADSFKAPAVSGLGAWHGGGYGGQNAESSDPEGAVL